MKRRRKRAPENVPDPAWDEDAGLRDAETRRQAERERLEAERAELLRRVDELRDKVAVARLAAGGNEEALRDELNQAEVELVSCSFALEENQRAARPLQLQLAALKLEEAERGAASAREAAAVAARRVDEAEDKLAAAQRTCAELKAEAAEAARVVTEARDELAAVQAWKPETEPRVVRDRTGHEFVVAPKPSPDPLAALAARRAEEVAAKARQDEQVVRWAVGQARGSGFTRAIRGQIEKRLWHEVERRVTAERERVRAEEAERAERARAARADRLTA